MQIPQDQVTTSPQDRSNKNYLLYPLADRALSSAVEALDHISYLKM
jgi:hypothetical protein